MTTTKNKVSKQDITRENEVLSCLFCKASIVNNLSHYHNGNKDKPICLNCALKISCSNEDIIKFNTLKNSIGGFIR